MSASKPKLNLAASRVSKRVVDGGTPTGAKRPRRTGWGANISRVGVFWGSPRILDVTWGGCLLLIRTRGHYLRLRPFGFGRLPRG